MLTNRSGKKGPVTNKGTTQAQRILIIVKNICAGFVEEKDFINLIKKINFSYFLWEKI